VRRAAPFGRGSFVFYRPQSFSVSSIRAAALASEWHGGKLLPVSLFEVDTGVGYIAYLATMPPNECPTIITDVTELAPLPSPYRARIASTAWFKNSAWQQDTAQTDNNDEAQVRGRSTVA